MIRRRLVELLTLRRLSDLLPYFTVLEQELARSQELSRQLQSLLTPELPGGGVVTPRHDRSVTLRAKSCE